MLISSSEEAIPSPVEAHSDAEEEDDEEYLVDYAPVRGTRTLQDVYLRCNLAMIEPTSSIEASSIAVWREAMLHELKLIERNKTWKLANLPANKKAIGVK